MIQSRGHTFTMHVTRFLIGTSRIEESLCVSLLSPRPSGRRHEVEAKAVRRICFRW